MHVRTAALAALLGVGVLPALPLPAQTPEEDRKALEKKIEALEKQQAEMQKQLEELKAALAARPTPTPTPAPPAPEPQAAKTGPVTSPGLTPYPVATWGETGQVTSGTTFNPAISVVTEGFYYADDRKGQAPSLYSQADGFGLTGVGGLRDFAPGFNLGETEFTFSAAVDPYFDALAILTVDPDTSGIEEAWIRTRRLLPGLSVKAGKFYSDVGYANKQHPHQWDFVDQNLAYAMLFNGQLNEVGLQIEYLPKTPVYMLVGAELLQGTNQAVANYLGPDANPALASKAGPRLFTGFFKVSPDVGWSDALQVGLSGGYDTMFQEQDGSVAGEGTAWFGGFEAIWKHETARPFGQGNFALQAEFLHRTINLDTVAGGASPPGQALKLQQNGYYVQAVYGFLPRFQAALRWDTAGNLNRLTDGPLVTNLETSRRFSAALTFNPTEFSRLRAQFSRASVPVGGIEQTFNQFFLQFQVSLGVHGAHKF